MQILCQNVKALGVGISLGRGHFNTRYTYDRTARVSFGGEMVPFRVCFFHKNVPTQGVYLSNIAP